MNDEELLTQFVRVRHTAQRIFFEVKAAELASDGAEALAERWRLAASLPRPALAVAVARVRLMLLADYRHFRVCDGCGERLPRGWFTSEFDKPDLCPDCRAGDTG